MKTIEELTEEVTRLTRSNAQLQISLAEAQKEHRRYAQYVDSLIAAVPVELRRHVVMRGGPTLNNGLWEIIIAKTEGK